VSVDSPSIVERDARPSAPTVLGAPDLHRRDGRWLDGWNPEDPDQWRTVGRVIARRNLGWSIVAEFLGFAVWAAWSIVVPQLPAAGFTLSVDQMFWLVSVPALVGATLRIPYTFAVPRFGGRNWTIASALLLLVPCLSLAWAVGQPQLPFGALLAIAALAGVGGGNFASSMANISFFFPDRDKGRALGINAAGGNIGTAAVQLAVPLVIVTSSGIALERAGLMFVPLALLAAFGAWRYMDNITDARCDTRAVAAAARNRHTWLLAFIYIGTFGSFIGYAGAFPTLLKSQFPEVTVSLAFLGALVGSVSRPVGGILADRFGGARMTIVAFGCMTVGALGVIEGLQTHSFVSFFASFLWLFVFSGVGNGSVYRMIPAVFGSQAANRGPEAALRAKRLAAGCIGIAGAVGAFGGFLIPRGFALSSSQTGSLVAAVWTFIGAYAVLAALTALVYARMPTGLAWSRI